MLISKDAVLTAAHNIFEKRYNSENTDFKFYLGADGVGEEYYEIEGWRYPDEYKTCKSSAQVAYDYAIMKLKRPIKFDKYLSLSRACPKCLLKYNNNIMLEIYGFPRKYPNDHPEHDHVFKGNF